MSAYIEQDDQTEDVFSGDYENDIIEEVNLE